MALKGFLDACKIAKLKPLFKNGSKADPSNYRPISLLVLLSKVFERVALDPRDGFLNLNKTLYGYQPGLRKNHSTDTCLSFLNDKILKDFVDCLLTGMILIDLQKAFDTIDHYIPLRKFREFKLNLQNSFSEISSFACGVTQGSTFNPLLFLIYVNIYVDGSEM